jgi:hypothetical protein
MRLLHRGLGGGGDAADSAAAATARVSIDDSSVTLSFLTCAASAETGDVR